MLEEDEQPVAAELSINQKFAARYDQRKRREELGRAEELGLLSGSESESETEDEGQLLTKKRDLEIHRVVEMIRARDPRIYDSGTALYDEAEDDGGHTQSAGDTAAFSAMKKPKVTVRSMMSHMLQRDGTLEDEDEDEDEGEYEEEDEGPYRGARHSRLEKNRSLAYNEEQRKLRSSLLEQLHGEGEGEEEREAGAEEGEDLFSKRRGAPSMDEAGISERLLEDDKVVSTFSARDKERLRKFISAPAKKEDDEFLRQFMVKRMWEDRDAMALPRYKDIVGDEEEEEEEEDGPAPDADAAAATPGGKGDVGEDEDEADLEEVERADDFEREFNFRFEPEAPGEGVEDRPHLLSFPRGGVEGSMRREKTTRREARKLRQERKAAEKKRIEEELRRLKNIKRRELEAKLQDLAEVSGQQEGAAFQEEDLDGEWDPEQHDRRMAELFGDGYYDEEEQDPHAAAARAEAGPTDAAAREEGAVAAGGEGEEEDQDEGDWVPRPAEEEWGPNGGGQGGAAEEAKKERDALLDELYGLDHEDIVAGMPTRFKYRPVPSNDYGLSAQEILALPDPDLNTFVSLKKLHPYREQEWRPDRTKRKWVRRRFRDVAKDWEKGAEKGKKAAERRKEHRDKRKRSRTELEAAAGVDDGQAKGPEVAQGSEEAPGGAEEAPKTGKRRRKKRGKGKGKGHASADAGEGVGDAGGEGPAAVDEPVTHEAPRRQGGEERRKEKGHGREKGKERGKKGSKSSAKKLSKQTGVSADRLSAYGL